MKIDKRLLKLTASSNLLHEFNCIVYVKNISFSLKHFKKIKIKVINIFDFISAVEILASSDELRKLANEQFVTYISSQSKVFAQIFTSKKILKMNNYSFLTQESIAYIDTGIAPHLDFVLGENRIIKFLDLVNYKLFPYDDNGHGTFIAGIGSGNGISSGGKYSGVAPSSKIVSIKALDKDGEADASKILEAMQWVANNYKKYNIKVVCMSFGSEPLGANDPIMMGAEKLWNEGIIVVTAAGNSGPEQNTIKSPGVSPKIITVGGFNDNRNDEIFDVKKFEIADFSSRGPGYNCFKPDLVAPSVKVISCSRDGGYTSLSGTSVATPMIAGLSFVATQLNHKLKPYHVKNALILSCRALTNNKNFEGSGMPNANKFLSKILKTGY